MPPAGDQGETEEKLHLSKVLASINGRGSHFIIIQGRLSWYINTQAYKPCKLKLIWIYQMSLIGTSCQLNSFLFFQLSWCIHSFLFGLCQEINQVRGHELTKVRLQEVLKGYMFHILAAYEKLSEEKQTKVGVETFSINTHAHTHHHHHITYQTTTQLTFFWVSVVHFKSSKCLRQLSPYVRSQAL